MLGFYKVCKIVFLLYIFASLALGALSVSSPIHSLVRDNFYFFGCAFFLWISSHTCLFLKLVIYSSPSSVVVKEAMALS